MAMEELPPSFERLYFLVLVARPPHLVFMLTCGVCLLVPPTSAGDEDMSFVIHVVCCFVDILTIVVNKTRIASHVTMQFQKIEMRLFLFRLFSPET